MLLGLVPAAQRRRQQTSSSRRSRRRCCAVVPTRLLVSWLAAACCFFTVVDAGRRHPIVKVFLLVGEANIEGFGSTPHLHALANTNADNTKSNTNPYAHLWNGTHWTTRDDVFVAYDHYRKDAGVLLHGPLSVNGHFGSSVNTFGPELQLGHVLGNAYSEPVVLIKAGWKGRSLAVDFASAPSSPKAGYQWFRMLKTIDAAAAAMPEILGSRDYQHCRLQIGGLVWWHGASDVDDARRRSAYGKHLEQFIRDIRGALKRPRLPIVVVELGGSGVLSNVDAKELEMREIQKEVVGEVFAKDDLVSYVPTAQYVQDDALHPVVVPGAMYPNGPESAKTVYYGNAETLLQISQAIAMTLLAADGRKSKTGMGWFSSQADLSAEGYIYRRQTSLVSRFLMILVIGAVVFVGVQRVLGTDDVEDPHFLSKWRSRFRPDEEVEYDDIPMEIELDMGSFQAGVN